MLRLALILGVAIGIGSASASAADPVPAFNAQIRPLFKANCFECHGEGEKLKGDLDLRLRRFAAKGGTTGPSFVEGKPEASLLLEKVTSGDMPPGKKKLTAAEIETLKQWIAAGAKVEAPEPETLAKGFQITDEDRKWWAFQPIKRSAVPTIQSPKSKVQTPIDLFLLAKLSDKGLSFAPPADKLTLIRRVTFDLTGLPPTPEEVDAFLKDTSADAYEKVVERLLASSRYGERWGRHWLDVAGYADSEGGSPEDPVRATAWKYRDYVIRSFNSDKPFDQFIREQLAGDELVKPPYPNLSPEDLDKLTATGFLRMAPDASGVAGIDPKIARNQVVNDTVKIVSSAFLGVTVGCAQCHNHRYDPIPQTDFYRLRAALEPAYDLTAWKVPAGREVSLYKDEERKMAAAVEAEAAVIDKQRLKKQDEYIETTFTKEVAKLPEEMRDKARAARTTPEPKRTAEQKKLMMEHPSLNVDGGSLYLYDSKAAAELTKIGEAAGALRAKKPTEQFVRVLTEVPGKVPPTFLFHRGDPDQPKDKIAPGGLNILDASLPLAGRTSDGPVSGSSGRRLALANWLTDPKQPLTSRVLVNRIWMHHFGKGLVGTPGDFGRLGDRPTHPELLDWLASEFQDPSPNPLPQGERGLSPPSFPGKGAGGLGSRPWDVKRLHKLIVTSATYRQSSRVTRDPIAKDPENKFLSRFPRQRLSAEMVRDQALFASGLLVEKLGGPSVKPYQPAGLWKELSGGVDYVQDTGEGLYRRSLYSYWKRTSPPPVLATFDAAGREICWVRDSRTNTPLQALVLLNETSFVEASRALAERVMKEAKTPEARLVTAFRRVTGRIPNEKEQAILRKSLEVRLEEYRDNPAAAKKLLAIGESKPDPKLDVAELAAYSVVCGLILNLDETVTKE